MKKFIELRLNDNVYHVRDGRTEINSFKLKELRLNGISTEVRNGGSGVFSIDVDEMEKSEILKRGYHHSEIWFFANKSDAVEYAKRQAMEELKMLKKKAETAIDQVIEFRKKHYDKLNGEWVQSEIDALKKLERETL